MVSRLGDIVISIRSKVDVLCLQKHKLQGDNLNMPCLKYGLKHVHGQELPPHAIQPRTPLEEQVKGKSLYLCISHDEVSLLTPDIVQIIKEFKL